MSRERVRANGRVCPGCGGSFLGRGRAKWCSDRCRRHTLYSGVCTDCGVPTYNGTMPPPSRCVSCASLAAIVWTPEAIVEAIRRWADETGGIPPSANDWRVAPEGFPSLSTVQNHFHGSLVDAVLAAGFVPNRSGHYGRDGEDAGLCAEIRARYEAGESTFRLAPIYGCSSQAIRYRVWKAGGSLCSRSEAQRLRYQAVAA